MLALMKTKYIFSKSGSCGATTDDLALEPVDLFDLGVAATFVNGNDMPQQFPGVTSADIYMRTIRRPHIGQVKEEGQSAISVDIVMKALAISHLLLGIGGTCKAPPHSGAHEHRLRTKILSSNGPQLSIGG